MAFDESIDSTQTLIPNTNNNLPNQNIDTHSSSSTPPTRRDILLKPYNSEKFILDKIGKWMRQTGYTMTPSESACVEEYNTMGVKLALVNMFGWTTLAYNTFKPTIKGVGLKTWVKVYGLVGFSIGAFISCIGSSRFAAKQCLKCFEKGDETEFKRVVCRYMKEDNDMNGNHRNNIEKQ